MVGAGVGQRLLSRWIDGREKWNGSKSEMEEDQE